MLNALAVLVLLVGSAGFVQRGAMRALDGSWDLTMIYAGARQLTLGGDPYDFDATFDTFLAAGGTDKHRDPLRFNSLYPPFTYALLAPLGLLSWSAAKIVWMLINVVAVVAIAFWFGRHRPRRGDTFGQSNAPPVWPILMALGLWFGCGTLHTAVAFGQLSVVTLALMLPALGPWRGEAWRGVHGKPSLGEDWRWGNGRTVLVGLLLALAGALKPQLMVVPAALLLATPRWRATVWGMMWGGLITFGSWAWVRSVAPNWLTHWEGQLDFFAQSGLASPTTANEFTYQMINLEPWLHRLWPGSAEWLGWLALGLPVLGLLVLGAVVAWSKPRPGVGHVFGSFRSRWDTDDFLLLAMSLGVVLELLSMYHRTYDAVLLVLPALWVWRRLSRQRGDVPAWIVAGCLLLFMLPGPAALVTLARQGTLTAALTESWLWRAWLLPHHNVALVIMALALGVRLLRGGPQAMGETAVSPVGDRGATDRP